MGVLAQRAVRWWVGAVAASAVVLAGASCTGDGPGNAPVPSPTGHVAHGPSAGSPAAPAPARAGERFVTLGMPRPYAPAAPAGGTDEYRCFLVDPGLSRAAFLTGSQFLPQNADLVHHAIFFRVEPADVPAARQLDADTPGEGWTCFGNAGVGAAAWVAHWAPGADETLLDPGIGYPMPPGSHLVMQVHYNLLTAAGATDRSGIRLRLSDRADLRPLHTALLLAPVELACAPGESGPLCEREAAVRDTSRRFGQQARSMVDQLNRHCNAGRPPVPATTQRCAYPVPGAGTVHAVAGHMHLLGRAITVRLNPGTARARTLLDLPAYDFDEQAVRPLAAPVTVRPGDTLEVSCTHDAGLRRRLPQLSPLPPRYVVWGEGTSDEMCLGLVIWTPAG